MLIKEKHIPMANLGLLNPGDVIADVAGRIPHPMNLGVHAQAWRFYKVHPPKGDPHPERTRPEYCTYDQTHEDYVYTKAWVDKLARDLADPAEYTRHGTYSATESSRVKTNRCYCEGPRVDSAADLRRPVTAEQVVPSNLP